MPQGRLTILPQWFHVLFTESEILLHETVGAEFGRFLDALHDAQSSGECIKQSTQDPLQRIGIVDAGLQLKILSFQKIESVKSFKHSVSGKQYGFKGAFYPSMVD